MRSLVARDRMCSVGSVLVRNCAKLNACSTCLKLERVFEVTGLHSEAGLVVGEEVILGHVRRPYNLCLVQDLVHFQDWSLLVWSAWVYRRKEPRFRFALELHYDAADIGRIRHPQKYSALDDIEIRVMFVRMIERNGDQHLETTIVFMQLQSCAASVVERYQVKE